MTQKFLEWLNIHPRCASFVKAICFAFTIAIFSMGTLFSFALIFPEQFSSMFRGNVWDLEFWIAGSIAAFLVIFVVMTLVIVVIFNSIKQT